MVPPEFSHFFQFFNRIMELNTLFHDVIFSLEKVCMMYCITSVINSSISIHEMFPEAMFLSGIRPHLHTAPLN